MELNLLEKVAFVSGSSRGIGLDIAKTLQAEGCEVVLNGRDEKSLQEASNELHNSAVICADMTNPQDTKRAMSKLMDKFGRLDILVCNVGSGRSAKPGYETFEDWQQSFSLNLWSTVNLVEAAREHLTLSKGSIVCISSICGLEVIPGAPITYSVAKASLNAYVKAISRPLGKMGIRINAVAPGNILFEGSVWEAKLSEDIQNVHKMLDREVSLSSLGDPKDISNLVAYLVSPLSSFATGSIWTVDGGQVRS